MKRVIRKEFWLDFYVLLMFATSVLLMIECGSDKRVGKILQSEVVIVPGIRKT